MKMHVKTCIHIHMCTHTCTYRYYIYIYIYTHIPLYKTIQIVLLRQNLKLSRQPVAGPTQTTFQLETSPTGKLRRPLAASSRRVGVAPWGLNACMPARRKPASPTCARTLNTPRATPIYTRTRAENALRDREDTRTSCTRTRAPHRTAIPCSRAAEEKRQGEKRKSETGAFM